jgi:ArsR family transcriptional regulator, arsenate/arsenite/antimonite-responsive transcriptional repressor
MAGDMLGRMADEIDVLRALAHPVRWGILERLAAEPGICACDFTEFFEVSQPTISAHLKALRAAGLVTAQRRGNTICYSLVGDRLAELAYRLAGMAARARAAGRTVDLPELALDPVTAGAGQPPRPQPGSPPRRGRRSG